MSLETKEQKEFTEIEATQIAKTTKPPRAERSRRPKPSVVENTAFWSTLVMALLGTGIAFLVKALSGILSQQLVILAVGGVITAILLLIRIRWTTLIATLLNGYLFYIIWTQPFVKESLSFPKGPDGGLGHFYGDVIIICTAILAVVCSLEATIQQFRGASRRTPRWYPVLIALVIGLAIGAMHIGDVSLPTAATSNASTVSNVTTLHVEATGFLQNSVTIAKGSKIKLVSDTSEEHLLFNGTWQNGTPILAHEAGAPTVNNVVLKGNSVTIGPFTTAGTYHIMCTLHQGMSLTIIVQ